MHSFWRKVGSQFERLLEGSAVPGAWQPQWPVADSEGTAALEEQKCFSSWESLLGCSSSAALLLCCVEIFLFFSTMLTFRPLHVFFFLSGTVKTGNFQSTGDLNSSLGKKNTNMNETCYQLLPNCSWDPTKLRRLHSAYEICGAHCR